MKADDLDTRMRQREIFHSLKVPLDNWTILRLDGRNFSKLTKTHFEKPFDMNFHQLMVTTAKALVEETNAIFAFTESDEISVLLPYLWDNFDREVEKMLSLSAALASATFSLEFGQIAQFDSRFWVSGDPEAVVDYFAWRQADTTRCALNGWAYWKLRQSGLSPKDATKRLSGATTSDKNEVLHQHGVNFNDIPNWQKRGTGIFFGSISKTGVNPITGETVVAQRRRIVVEENLPKGPDYQEYVREKVLGGCVGPMVSTAGDPVH